MCGKISLSMLIAFRMLGVTFPKVANFLITKKYITPLIILLVHIASMLFTWPSIDFGGWRRCWITYYANLDFAVCEDS